MAESITTLTPDEIANSGLKDALAAQEKLREKVQRAKQFHAKHFSPEAQEKLAIDLGENKFDETMQGHARNARKTISQRDRAWTLWQQQVGKNGNIRADGVEFTPFANFVDFVDNPGLNPWPDTNNRQKKRAWGLSTEDMAIWFAREADKATKKGDIEKAEMYVKAAEAADTIIQGSQVDLLKQVADELDAEIYGDLDAANANASKTGTPRTPGSQGDVDEMIEQHKSGMQTIEDALAREKEKKAWENLGLHGSGENANVLQKDAGTVLKSPASRVARIIVKKKPEEAAAEAPRDDTETSKILRERLLDAMLGRKVEQASSDAVLITPVKDVEGNNLTEGGDLFGGQAARMESLKKVQELADALGEDETDDQLRLEVGLSDDERKAYRDLSKKKDTSVRDKAILAQQEAIDKIAAMSDDEVLAEYLKVTGQDPTIRAEDLKFIEETGADTQQKREAREAGLSKTVRARHARNTTGDIGLNKNAKDTSNVSADFREALAAKLLDSGQPYEAALKQGVQKEYMALQEKRATEKEANEKKEFEKNRTIRVIKKEDIVKENGKRKSGKDMQDLVNKVLGGKTTSGEGKLTESKKEGAFIVPGFDDPNVTNEQPLGDISGLDAEQRMKLAQSVQKQRTAGTMTEEAYNAALAQLLG
jgi:dihydroneopterin aldolase